ncbi:hypothetical protein GCM10022255_043770 [Dactylosporangium darangshiense]|uniref:Uncharacterized protein n=1 Tax=Dactylosporangium darangshiense TaxID=579108 RepID=A0ABP8DAL3_9ACTN
MAAESGERRCAVAAVSGGSGEGQRAAAVASGGERWWRRAAKGQSQPLDWATPTASMRLRVPVFVMAADR